MNTEIELFEVRVSSNEEKDNDEEIHIALIKLTDGYLSKNVSKI